MADAGIGEAAIAEGGKAAGEAGAAAEVGAGAAEAGAATEGAAAVGAAGADVAGAGAAGAAGAGGAGAAGAIGAAAPAAGGGLTMGQMLALNAASSVASTLMKPVAGLGASGRAPIAGSPTTMPTADGEAIAAARKKSIIEQMSNRGRASTILTDQTTDKLGG